MYLFDLSQWDPRILLGLQEEKENFLCCQCKTKITEKEYFISVNGNSPLHSCTNPSGFTYNIITFSHCESLVPISPPESQATWFPGYSWIILDCSVCGQMMGWKFISEKEQPKSFFALIRDKIVLS